MVNGYVIKLITLEIYETLYFMCVWTCCCDHSSKVNAFLLHSKIFLIPNQSYFLSIQITMASTRIYFLIPFILLRISETIYYMPKSLFFLNFLTIKITPNYTVLKVISTGQICTTSIARTKS